MGRTNNENVSYIQGLDGLRAISVVLVIFFHYASYFPSAFTSSNYLPVAIGKTLSIGWVGVDVFFVISGFLITTMLIRNPVNSVKKYLTFIQRRAKRLLPAYFFCVIAIVLAATFIYPDAKIISNQYLLWTMSSNIASLFGDRSALGGAHFSMFHFWSLALEWQFYITFPLALLLIKSVRSAALMAISLAIATRISLIYFSPLNYDNAIYSLTLCRGDALAAGVFLATLPSAKNISKTHVIGAAGFFSLIALLFTISVSKVPFKSILWLQTVGYTGLAVSISMTIYWVLNTTRTSPALRALELPWVTAVGRTSYSLYIWHLPLYPIIVAISKNVFESAQGQFLFSASLAIFVTGTLGVLSYRIIESKFMYSRPNTNNIRDIKPAEI